MVYMSHDIISRSYINYLMTKKTHETIIIIYAILYYYRLKHGLVMLRNVTSQRIRSPGGSFVTEDW